jgi:hypothetical protein
MRALHHDAPARSVSVGGKGDDRLAVVGTADHTLRAWRGPEPAWESGIAYLDREDQSASGRGRRSGGGLGGRTWRRSWRQSGPAGDPRRQRHLID